MRSQQPKTVRSVDPANRLNTPDHDLGVGCWNLSAGKVGLIFLIFCVIMRLSLCHIDLDSILLMSLDHDQYFDTINASVLDPEQTLKLID